MILTKSNEEFNYNGQRFYIGQRIIGNDQSEYNGLIGTITEICDGEDKETENDTPDIYCSFEPPILPHDIRELEKVFSDLYNAPKSIDDITLDMVIMAPEMICSFDDLQKKRHNPTIYVLQEDWAVDGESGGSVEIYTDFDDAKRMLVRKLQEDKENGCIEQWSDDEDFVVDSTPTSYECYIDGEYCENYYAISISTQKLCASDQFVRELADFHKV